MSGYTHTGEMRAARQRPADVGGHYGAGPVGSDWFTAATARSETGRVARSVDWAATSLGDPDTWPGGLRTAVELCFSTRFPVLVAWGPDLVKIYNDGYREMLGSDKHPAAMGAPASVVWSEIWDTVGPLFEQVLATGEPTWVVDQRLVINRSGFAEETYFTYSYSALRDDGGSVQGVLDIATETTDQVVGWRRLRCLAELSSRLHAVGDDVAAVGAVAVEVLEANPADVQRAALHLAASEGGLALLASTRGEHRDPAQALVVPLRSPGEDDVGVLELELPPHRPIDDDARDFIDLVAGEVGTALGGAVRRQRELHRLETVSEALQRSMLPVIPDSPALAARYLPAADHLTIGGDWYDAVDLPGGRLALLVGDCVGHGLDAAALMGNLRSASRALLLEHHGAAAVIEGLDRFARTIPGATCTTVLCLILDPDAGTITQASAGHLPALALGRDGAAWIDGVVDPPLGVDASRPRREAVVSLDGVEALVLYTDGLVERRGETIDDGLNRLAAAALDMAAGTSAQRLADGIIAALPEDRGDDAAILVHVPGR